MLSFGPLPEFIQLYSACCIRIVELGNKPTLPMWSPCVCHIATRAISRGGLLSAASGTPVSQSNHSLPCFISQQVDENSILRPTFSPGVHTDSSFARERPQSNR